MRARALAAALAVASLTPVYAERATGLLSLDAADGPGLRRSSSPALKLPVPRRFDLSHVDPAQFAAALGNEPTRVFNYVRDEIAFESYAGLLRGPRGTLLAMAGNSIDRASLLAAMLTASGQRVRFAYGILPRARVDQLVASMWLDRRVERLAASAVPTEIKTAGDAFFARIEHDTLLLQSRLRQAGIPGTAISAPTADALVRETQEHYWVQWSHDGAWIDLDPSFASSQPGQTYTVPQHTFDTIPDRLFHRVELRVRVEEYTGPKPASRVVFQYARRAADLSGLDLILAHDPEVQNNTWTNQFTPVLIVDREAIRGNPFWLSAPRQVAEAAIVDAFGGGSDPEPSPVAMAEFVEIELVAPDNRRETVVREIFDRVGQSRRSRNETLTADLVANASEPSNPDFTQGVYDFFITTGAIDASHVKNLDPEAPSVLEPGRVDVGAGFHSMNTTFAVLSDALLGRVTDKTGRIVRTYFDTPRVQVADLTGKATAPRLSLDLRRDTARALVQGLQPRPAFNAQLLRGVVDGTLERLVVETFGGGAPDTQLERRPVFGTSWVFEKAEANKTPIVLMTRNDRQALAEAGGDARARIDEALAAGAVIVAPARPLSMVDTPAIAWWQVDPQTGVTTAVTGEGLHQAVQAVIIRVYGAVGVAISVGGQFLPRAIQFANQADARAFCQLMEIRMLAQNISFNWFQLPF